MKTITIRGIDDTIAAKLKIAAVQQGISINQFVLDALKKRLGLKKEKRFTAIHNDMDHLFGKWSEEEFKRIQGKIDAERKIDRELWK